MPASKAAPPVQGKRGVGRPTRYLTEVELADLLEIADGRQLRRWRAEGCPHVLRSGRVLYRLPQVQAWREERAVRALDADETKERARKMRADADRAELIAARLRGELGPIAEMEEAVERLASAVRDEVRGLRARFTLSILGLTAPAEAAAVLDEMGHQILGALTTRAADLGVDEDEVAAA